MIELGPPSRGHVTQRFAQRQLQDGQPHAGQDWAYRNNETGEVFADALAMADGVVAWADDTRKLGWPNPWYFNPDFDRTDDVDMSAGNAVVLKHWFGWTTYCHLEETPLNIGDQVRRGQRVGTVGATGYSAGRHLHSDLILNGADVSRAPLYGRSDPNPYLTGTITAQSATITPLEEGFLMALSDQDQIEVRDNLRKLVGSEGAQDSYAQGMNEKLDEIVGNSRKTFWNSEESKNLLRDTPAADLAAKIDAAGIAAAVRDELAKLIGGK